MIEGAPVVCFQRPYSTVPLPNALPHKDTITKSFKDPILGKKIKESNCGSELGVPGCGKFCNPSNELLCFLLWVYCTAFQFKSCH